MLSFLWGEQVWGGHAEVTCAGRTDAGVHARGQVVHLDAFSIPTNLTAERINRALPTDIRVLKISEVTVDFHARFSALWRRYSYRVCDRVTGPDPLLRHMALAWHRPVDIDAVNEASAKLLGEHDFVAFCKERDGATTVRQLLELHWERDAAGDAVMTITSDAFCHSMVRSIVGSLLPVGDHRKPTTWPYEILRSKNKTAGVTVMPPHPLVLEEVGYPETEAELAARQALTRSRRALQD